MTTPTRPADAQLTQDLNATLSRLRMARRVDDQSEIRASERRLNWLLDKITTQQTP